MVNGCPYPPPVIQTPKLVAKKKSIDPMTEPPRTVDIFTLPDIRIPTRTTKISEPYTHTIVVCSPKKISEINMIENGIRKAKILRLMVAPANNPTPMTGVKFGG